MSATESQSHSGDSDTSKTASSQAHTPSTNGNSTNNTTTTTSGIIKDKAAVAISYAQRSLNRVVPPSSRRRAYSSASELASARPLFFAFIALQLLFSILPITIFVTFAVSTIAFTFCAAVLFALVWIGFAFLLLVPTLLFTASAAVLFWGWVAGSFLAAKWLYNHAPAGVFPGSNYNNNNNNNNYSNSNNKKGVEFDVAEYKKHQLQQQSGVEAVKNSE